MSDQWRPPRHRRRPKDRRTPVARREQLLTIAAALAETQGFDRVTREQIAALAGCSGGLISRYWSASGLQTALVEHAVATRSLIILGQALAARHPLALAAPLDLRRAAAAALVGP